MSYIFLSLGFPSPCSHEPNDTTCYPWKLDFCVFYFVLNCPRFLSRHLVGGSSALHREGKVASNAWGVLDCFVREPSGYA